MRRILLYVVTLFLAVAAFSAELDVNKLTVRTLPSDIYAKLIPGQKLALIWRDTNFKGGPPSAVAVTWKAEDRNGNLFQYLKTQAMTLAETPGVYTLELTATFYREGKVGYVKDTPPEIIVEGVLKAGEVVLGAFVTKAKGELAGLEGWNYNAMGDAILAGIVKDFVNAKQ